MNVLYLHTHDSGRYLDPSCSPVPLTGIRTLSEAAVTFRNAFCAAPTCSPSRSALLTGRCPHANGMVGLVHRGFALNRDSVHLARVFERGGYETVLCGVQHVAAHKADIGYLRILDEPVDYFDNPESASPSWDERNAERVIDYIRSSPDRPWFLSLGLHSTHRPFPEVPRTLSPRDYPLPPGVLPDLPEIRSDMTGFTTALRVVDGIVGRIIDALKENGLWGDTIVLLTTDHGPAFPDMKGTLYDGGIGVAMILRVPGLADDGRVEEALVSQIDVYPTLCRLIGLPEPEKPEGRDLIPLLRGDLDEVRHSVFAETSFHAAYEPARCVRTRTHKLIRHYGSMTTPLPVNVDDSPTKDVWKAAGYFRRSRSREELFDLILDPLERSNIADTADRRDIQEALGRSLDEWMNQTGDPIISGDMPRPPGSRLNRPDAWSPTEETYE